MAEHDVIEDLSLLQRYSREHSELEEIAQKYYELVNIDKQITEAREMYDSDDSEMHDLAYEEMERLKAAREQLLDEVKVSLLPKDIMDEKNAIVTIQGGPDGDKAPLFPAQLFRMSSPYPYTR